MRHRTFLAASVVFVIAALPVLGSHGADSNHWGRPCSTCAASITVYDSTVTTNTNWSDHLSKSVFGDPNNPNTDNRGGWDDSPAVTLSISASSNDASTRETCPSVTGAIRVCNYTYGTELNWLGRASSVSNLSGHFIWAIVQINDSHFNGGGYPEPEKRSVMCQEMGHNFGLAHTSENGSSQNTCMDYYSSTGSTDWTSTGPNSHDFEQILTQTHWGSKTYIPAEHTLKGPSRPEHLDEVWQWGTPVGFDSAGRANRFKLDLVDADGEKYVMWTSVIWAPEKRTPDSGMPNRGAERRRR